MKRWGILVAISVTTAVALSSAPTAPAVTYQPQPHVKYEPAPADPKPPFCQEATVHDYLAPLRRMRKLHAPPPNGHIGFGPARLVLKTSPPLLVGEGAVGYSLYLNQAPSVHPNWTLTTTLARVDAKGRVTKVVERRRRRVTKISPSRGAGVRFAVPDKPAAYRVAIGFRNKKGRQLGSFGFYVLAVAPSVNTRVSLNASSYRREQTVFARVENLGAASALFGASYTIERLEAGEWVKAPESPLGPWPASLLIVGPGRTGPCDEFRIPSSMPGGTYRIVKGITHVGGAPGGPSPPAQISAEFQVRL